MARRFTSEAHKRLLEGDVGQEIAPGFYMQDLGRQAAEDEGPALVTDTLPSIKPKTRSERRKVAKDMAAQLMDHYMDPVWLNDDSILNPIRDGIPQCRAHPFTKGSRTQIGCIYGCGARERDNGALPVARDYTVADVWQWVSALIEHAVNTMDARTGFAVKPDLTPGR